MVIEFGVFVEDAVRITRMFPALNITIQIWRRSAKNDDDIGGTVTNPISPIQTGVPARIGNSRTPLSQRIQGIEVSNMYDCLLWDESGTLNVKENDLIIPETGQYANEQFLVQAVQTDSLADDSNNRLAHKYLSLLKVDYARQIM